MPIVAHEFSNRVIFLRMGKGRNWRVVLVERAKDFLLGVVDVDNRIFMDFVVEPKGKGAVQFYSTHNLIKNVIIDCVLHAGEQFNLNGFMHVAQHHFFGDYFIVFANIFISYQHLLHREKTVEFFPPAHNRNSACIFSP